MFQIFLITSYLALAPLAFAQEKAPPTLEEINADLLAKKAEMEPFDEKKVKIDLESLGLDDVDKKTVEKPKEAVPAEKDADKKASEQKPEAQPAPETPPVPSAQSLGIPAESTAPKGESIISRIQNLLRKDRVEPKAEALPATSAADIKKPTAKYINSSKKQNLKKRLEAEKRERQRKSNEKRQADKLKKLNELRQKYLIRSEEDMAQGALRDDEDFESESKKIIPHKKDLNRFVTEELPALPILNRYRTTDNLHIPIVFTPREHVQVLFNAIVIGSISFFNDAYKNVDNPNAKNDRGDTILTCATLLQKYPVMASVLAKGADPNMPNHLGYNPATIAIEMLDIKAFQLLADNKADLTYTDAFGRTYLMHAARVGFLPAVELLISRGADINAMDKDGFTALSIAYRNKKEIIVKFLLKNGAQTWIEKPYNPQEQSLIKELENRWR